MTVHETALLGALIYDRKAYDAVAEHMDPEELTAHGAAIFEEIVNWYQRDEDAKRCDPKLLRDRIVRRMPKQRESFELIFREFDPDMGSTNVVREVLELKRRAMGDELVVAIAQGQEPSELVPLLDEYTLLNNSTDLLDAGGGIPLFETPLDQLVMESVQEDNLIKLLPNRLNAAIRGGALPGHTVVIIGRVNVGKSALAINNIAGFLRQGKRVLLIENEDLVDDVKRRIGIRLCGKSLDWAEAHPQEFARVGKERGIDNLLIPDPPPATTGGIDRACEILKPDVVVVNQLRHLAPSKAAESDNTGAVDRVAQQLRATGKRRRVLMVMVGAAKEGERDRDGNPIEKAVLEMSDAYGSRTGVPGCADFLITIGTNQSLKDRGMLCVHLAKNKRGSGEPTLYQKVNLENCIFTDA